MPKIKTPPQNRLLDEYLELNEPAKKKLREDFNTEFDYSDQSSTFWRKLNNPAQVWSHEKKFLAEKLSLSEKELFPKVEEVVK